MIKFKTHLYNVYGRRDFEGLGIPGPKGWFCQRVGGDAAPEPYEDLSDEVHGQRICRPVSNKTQINSLGKEVQMSEEVGSDEV